MLLALAGCRGWDEFDPRLRDASATDSVVEDRSMRQDVVALDDQRVEPVDVIADSAMDADASETDAMALTDVVDVADAMDVRDASDTGVPSSCACGDEAAACACMGTATKLPACTHRTATCNAIEPCPANYACSSGRCVCSNPSVCGPACVAGACPCGLVCNGSNRCVLPPRCAFNEHCAAGQFCRDGQCLALPPAGPNPSGSMRGARVRRTNVHHAVHAQQRLPDGLDLRRVGQPRRSGLRAARVRLVRRELLGSSADVLTVPHADGQQLQRVVHDQRELPERRLRGRRERDGAPVRGVLVLPRVLAADASVRELRVRLHAALGDEPLLNGARLPFERRLPVDVPDVRRLGSIARRARDLCSNAVSAKIRSR
jgi:hypothetical protein